MPEIDPNLFRSFADAMPCGACIVDTQAKILYWNAAAESITGYQSAEVLGRSYRGDMLVHREQDGSAQVQCPLLEVLRDGRAVDSELYLLHKQGHRLPMRVAAFPLRDGEGTLRGVGELFEPLAAATENPLHLHGEHEFELAAGLPSIEESWTHVRHTAASSALILIDVRERDAVLQHGGAAMLHQSIRVLARTISVLLPPERYLGCWSHARMLAVVPECSPENLHTIEQNLNGVGSSSVVKWWGDRVAVGIRVAAAILESKQSGEELVHSLEQQLPNSESRSV